MSANQLGRRTDQFGRRVDEKTNTHVEIKQGPNVGSGNFERSPELEALCPSRLRNGRRAYNGIDTIEACLQPGFLRSLSDNYDA